MAQPDPFQRSRHGTQAYTVTSFGKPIETAKSGYGRRITGTPICMAQVVVDAGVTTEQTIGDMTAGLVVLGATNLAALTAGTAEVALAATDTEPEAILIAALDLATISDAPVPAILVREDRELRVTITGGTVGETAAIGLHVVPVISPWA